MDCKEIFINGYEDVLEALEHTLSGLDLPPKGIPLIELELPEF